MKKVFKKIFETVGYIVIPVILMLLLLYIAIFNPTAPKEIRDLESYQKTYNLVGRSPQTINNIKMDFNNLYPFSKFGEQTCQTYDYLNFEENEAGTFTINFNFEKDEKYQNYKMTLTFGEDSAIFFADRIASNDYIPSIFSNVEVLDISKNFDGDYTHRYMTIRLNRLNFTESGLIYNIFVFKYYTGPAYETFDNSQNENKSIEYFRNDFYKYLHDLYIANPENICPCCPF